MIEKWLQDFPTDEAALKALADHRVPAGPVLSIEETVAHPYFAACNMVRQVPDQILEDVTIPEFSFKFSACPEELKLEAPLLGVHHRLIRSQCLGRSPDTPAELYNHGVSDEGKS